MPDWNTLSKIVNPGVWPTSSYEDAPNVSDASSVGAMPAQVPDNRVFREDVSTPGGSYDPNKPTSRMMAAAIDGIKKTLGVSLGLPLGPAPQHMADALVPSGVGYGNLPKRPVVEQGQVQTPAQVGAALVGGTNPATDEKKPADPADPITELKAQLKASSDAAKSAAEAYSAILANPAPTMPVAPQAGLDKNQAIIMAIASIASALNDRGRFDPTSILHGATSIVDRKNAIFQQQAKAQYDAAVARRNAEVAAAAAKYNIAKGDADSVVKAYDDELDRRNKLDVADKQGGYSLNKTMLGMIGKNTVATQFGAQAIQDSAILSPQFKAFALKNQGLLSSQDLLNLQKVEELKVLTQFDYEQAQAKLDATNALTEARKAQADLSRAMAGVVKPNSDSLIAQRAASAKAMLSGLQIQRDRLALAQKALNDGNKLEYEKIMAAYDIDTAKLDQQAAEAANTARAVADQIVAGYHAAVESGNDPDGKLYMQENRGPAQYVYTSSALNAIAAQKLRDEYARIKGEAQKRLWGIFKNNAEIDPSKMPGGNMQGAITDKGVKK